MPPPRSRSTFTPADAGLFVALAASWGLSFVFIKVAVESVSPLWIVVARTGVGGALLLAALGARRASLPRDPVIWGHLAVLAVLGNATPWAAVAWAQQFIPSGLSAVVNSMVPATTLAIAAAVGLERLTARKLGGLALAAAGVLIVLGGEVGAPGRVGPLLVVVFASLGYGGGAVWARRYVSGRVAPLAVAAGQVTLASVLTAPVALAVDGVPAVGAIPFEAVASLVALGAFGTGLAFLLFYLLIARVGATYSTMVTYVIPVIGLAAGWALLGERFGPHVFAGLAVIVAGIYLAQRQRVGGDDGASEVGAEGTETREAEAGAGDAEAGAAQVGADGRRP